MLTGVAIGAALVAIPTVASMFFLGAKDDLFVRIAEDSPVTGTEAEFAEHGPKSAWVAHACGIASVVIDSAQIDHTASSFFRVADASTNQLNCVIGKARAAHLGLAFTRGVDTSEFYKIAGDPIAYTRCDPATLVAGTCKLKKN